MDNLFSEANSSVSKYSIKTGTSSFLVSFFTKVSSDSLSFPRRRKLQCAMEKSRFSFLHKCAKTTLSTPPLTATRIFFPLRKEKFVLRCHAEIDCMFLGWSTKILLLNSENHKPTRF